MTMRRNGPISRCHRVVLLEEYNGPFVIKCCPSVSAIRCGELFRGPPSRVVDLATPSEIAPLSADKEFRGVRMLSEDSST